MKIITIRGRNFTTFPGMEISIISGDQTHSVCIYNALKKGKLIEGSASFDPRIGKLIEADIIADLTDPDEHHVNIDNCIEVFNYRQKIAESLTPDHHAFMKLGSNEMQQHDLFEEVMKLGLIYKDRISIETSSKWRMVLQVVDALNLPKF